MCRRGGGAARVDTMSAVWVGFQGETTITRMNTSAGAGALLTASLACSHADKLQTWEGTNVPNATPTPTAGDYSPVSSQAALVFVTAVATQVTLLVPAPLRSIFLADGQTVDTANASVIALVAAAIAALVDSTGNPVIALVSGTLR